MVGAEAVLGAGAVVTETSKVSCPEELEEYDEEPSRLTGKEGYISRAQEEPGEQRPVELCGKRRVVIAA